jgi:hypothetical protein
MQVEFKEKMKFYEGSHFFKDHLAKFVVDDKGEVHQLINVHIMLAIGNAKFPCLVLMQVFIT